MCRETPRSVVEVFVPATGCVWGDTCTASTGTNPPEGQRKGKNGPDCVKHVLLAVQQRSLAEERVDQGFCPC